MDLKTFIADGERRAALAKACDTTPEYLYQLSVRWRGRRPSKSLARLIERESARILPPGVPLSGLRAGAAAGVGQDEVEHDPDAGRIEAVVEG
jgi:hypothetical protein